MLRMARSESCQGGRGSRRRTPSPSPETLRKSTHKRKEGSIANSGGDLVDLSRVVKKEQKGSSRERSRSKSPRRNSWREEIKDIRSWREDGVARFETPRDRYTIGKKGRESKKTSRGHIKFDKKVKKCLDLLERKSCFKARIAAEASARFGKKKEDLKKNSRRIISWKEKQPYNDDKREIITSYERDKRSTSLELGKVSGVMNQVNEELVRKEVKKTDMKDTVSQTDQQVFVKASTECEDVELELALDDKDVFPELRDEHYEYVESIATAGNASENKDPSKINGGNVLNEIKIDQVENLAAFCPISVNENVEEEEQIEIEKSETELTSSGCLDPQADAGSGMATVSNDSSFSLVIFNPYEILIQLIISFHFRVSKTAVPWQETSPCLS